MTGEWELTFSEIFKKHNFRGSKSNKVASPESEIVLDYSEPNKANISTSVDCYVSGQYVSTNSVLEVNFRFNIYVKYSADTVDEAMAGVRQRVEQDFQREFPGFELTSVIIPKERFIIPTARGSMSEDEFFYYGSNLYKRITQMDQARFDMRVHRDIYDKNIDIVKDRYGLK